MSDFHALFCCCVVRFLESSFVLVFFFNFHFFSRRLEQRLYAVAKESAEEQVRTLSVKVTEEMGKGRGWG